MTETITFAIPKSRKRLVKILATKLDKANLSALCDMLLTRALDQTFSAKVQRQLLRDTEAKKTSAALVAHYRNLKPRKSKRK